MALRALASSWAVFAIAALTACARSTATAPPATRPDGPVAAPSPAEASDGGLIAEAALSLVGAPYQNGGSGPSGFDCSGFVQYVFAERGLLLPRGVGDQFGVGRPVALQEIGPGDLVFFSTTARGPTHVGIAVGPDAFVHAPSSNGRVRVERLSAPYWAQRFLGGRRVVRSSITPR